MSLIQKRRKIMIRNFFKWNEINLSKEKPTAEEVLRNGKRVNFPAMPKKTVLELGKDRYHIKIPHSRFYKNNKNMYAKETVLRDNFICTTGELISERKYKAFNFMTAGYDMTKKNNEYVLVSKRIDDEKLELCSLYDMIKYPLDEDMRSFSREIATLTLRELLERKPLILGILDENCYDKLIEFLLLSVFEFSDDDHFNNIIFVKNTRSERFHNMFVCDKESTVFNSFIAIEGDYYGSLVDYTLAYDSYIGKIIKKPFEDYKVRAKEIGKLIKKGIMPQKYINFLKEVAGFDFDAVARDINCDFGIQANQKQLDMFKLGGELIGEVIEKNM